MQTFLPDPSFTISAKLLDDKRLGKQRVEVLQILQALAGESEGWTNHPATKMWDGYTEALVLYGVIVCDEWRRRGFHDQCREKILAHKTLKPVVMPPWLGRHDFHASHRSNLKRKDPKYYAFDVPDDLEYVWPI